MYMFELPLTVMYMFGLPLTWPAHLDHIINCIASMSAEYNIRLLNPLDFYIRLIIHVQNSKFQRHVSQGQGLSQNLIAFSFVTRTLSWGHKKGCSNQSPVGHHSARCNGFRIYHHIVMNALHPVQERQLLHVFAHEYDMHCAYDQASSGTISSQSITENRK